MGLRIGSIFFSLLLYSVEIINKDHIVISNRSDFFSLQWLQRMCILFSCLLGSWWIRSQQLQSTVSIRDSFASSKTTHITGSWKYILSVSWTLWVWGEKLCKSRKQVCTGEYIRLYYELITWNRLAFPSGLGSV